MRMMRWASKTHKPFLIHVRGTIPTIKEMELDTKFQEAIRAVEYANLDVKLSKMAYKDELKKGERDDVCQQAVGAGNAAPDKAKQLKKKEGDKSLQAVFVAAMASLNEARKARNEAQE